MTPQHENALVCCLLPTPANHTLSPHRCWLSLPVPDFLNSFKDQTVLLSLMSLSRHHNYNDMRRRSLLTWSNICIKFEYIFSRYSREQDAGTDGIPENIMNPPTVCASATPTLAITASRQTQ